MDVIKKMIELADVSESEIAEKLLENALEDCVSAFDGFGRELVGVYATYSSSADKARKISFQNIDNASKLVSELFEVSLKSFLDAEQWKQASIAFETRHLIAHKMGVIDEKYLKATGLPLSHKGRKVSVTSEQISKLVELLAVLAGKLYTALENTRVEASGNEDQD
jgi:hypothetical protein